MSEVAGRLAALPQAQRRRLHERLRRQLAGSASTASRRPRGGDALVWLSQPENPRLRLFCLPYAAGGASIYRSWPDRLPPDVAVCAVQLPGRETRIGEAPIRDVGPLVAEVAEQVAGAVGDEPFAIYGHSMGGLLSFELARRLRSGYKRQPAALLVGAYRAPQLPNQNFRIYHLPIEVLKVVLRAQGIPEPVLQNDELMRAMIPTLRADLELCDRYAYSEAPPFDCPVTVFGGASDATVSADELDGWRQHTAAAFHVTLIEGGHFFLHTAPGQLLENVSTELTKVATPTAAPGVR